MAAPQTSALRASCHLALDRKDDDDTSLCRPAGSGGGEEAVGISGELGRKGCMKKWAERP